VDDDLVLADRNEFLRIELLALPHPLHPRQPLTHTVVATIDSAIERRLRVVQDDVRVGESDQTVEMRVINYGASGHFRTQAWDTPVTSTDPDGTLRSRVVPRKATFYQPDGFISLKRKKWRLDAEIAFNIGSVGTHEAIDVQKGTVTQEVYEALQKPVDFFQMGGALQTDVALLSADARSSSSKMTTSGVQSVPSAKMGSRPD